MIEQNDHLNEQLLKLPNQWSTYFRNSRALLPPGDPREKKYELTTSDWPPKMSDQPSLVVINRQANPRHRQRTFADWVHSSFSAISVRVFSRSTA
jgi:hypothetical protein